MVVSQVDQDQIKELEINDSKKKHRVKHMHSPMNLNCLNHPVILGGRTTIQMFTSMSIQIPAIDQTNAVRNQQKDIKAMQRKSAAMIYVQRERRLTEGYSFKVYSMNSQTTYSVIIDQNPRCTCPYFMKKPKNRKQIYKHILWVYVRVYRLPKNSCVLQQTALTKAECQDILKSAPSFVPIDLCQQKVQGNDHHSHLTSRELDALFSDYDNLTQRWVATKLNEGSTAHCAGCLKSIMIAGRLCIVVNGKFVPKDFYFAVDRKFYFCAVAQCLKNKPRSSNLRGPSEKVEADQTIDDSTKQLLNARNIPLC